MAVAECRDFKDRISIYDTCAWNCCCSFVVDTFDLEEISWSPCGRYIAVADTPVEVFYFLTFSIKYYCIHLMDGVLKCSQHIPLDWE